MSTDFDGAALVATMPFAAAVGVQIAAADPDEVVATLEWAEDRCTVGGVLHGGALMTLADSAGARRQPAAAHEAQRDRRADRDQ